MKTGKNGATKRVAARDRGSFSKNLPLTPEFEARWHETAERRELARSLIGMRRAKGLTQKELAQLMGKDQAFVSRMESATAPLPKAQHIALYARHCGYKTAYAFLEESQDSDVTLQALCAIGQDPAETARLTGPRHQRIATRAAAKTAAAKRTAAKTATAKTAAGKKEARKTPARKTGARKTGARKTGARRTRAAATKSA